ncbi:MAG: S9 family peptidase [Hyphomicrobiaceae bacterium]|nr:S9 family peptidase [Hyphomicrobiaceae bacterium]
MPPLGTLPAAPRAEKRPVTVSHHGVSVTDDYGWLRADNWQDVMRDPTALPAEIRAYLEAENAYTDAVLGDTKELQDKLFAEMKARIKEDDNSVPSPDGAWAYYSSFVTGGQYPRVMRSKRDGSGEVVLLDGNAEAQGKDYWQLGSANHSPDHRWLAYAVDDKGSELFTLRIRDLQTGVDLDDAVPDTHGGVWADNDTLFYVKLDNDHRPLEVWRHARGTAASADVLVYEEKDKGFYVGLGRTQSARFITIDVHDHQTTEVYLIDSARPFDAPRLVAPRRFGHEYSVEHHGDDLIIMTNKDAEDFQILSAPIASPAEAHWQPLVPHRSGRLIIEAVAYKNYLVRLEREESLPRIVIRRWADGVEHSIAFDEEAYSLGVSQGYEYDTGTLRFTYSSMTTPSEVIDYDIETKTRTLRKRQEIPSGHNPTDYVTRRVFAPTRDGETVPVSLLYRKGTPLDSTAPLFLYGYGSYGISIPASFSTTRLSLVDRGFVFAIAHIRGGKDKGYRWYTGGKKQTKLNTFHDFIDAGEYLAKEKFTTRGRIVANGGSAGGMLMGVVANMAPDLFLGIIADVPFVDVLNTMLDASLPLTPPEWLEWGNPIESEKEFALIASYSPYDNVAAKPYPHIFAYGGLTDPRVTYWEPAKWIARLRANSTSDNMIVMKINMAGGHGGASGRFEQLHEMALDYAFALKISDRAGA